MDDNKFWSILWSCLAICFCVLVLTIGVCVGYQKTLESSALSKSSDPARLQCVYDAQNDGSRIACLNAHKE